MSLPELTQVIDELTSLGITVPAGRVRLDGYGDSAALSAQLIALIVAGRKRAGTGLLWGYETTRTRCRRLATSKSCWTMRGGRCC